MRASVDNSGAIYVCGTVNAKNSFGGYVGEEAYIGGIEGAIFHVVDIAQDETAAASIPTFCARYGVPS